MLYPKTVNEENFQQNVLWMLWRIFLISKPELLKLSEEHDLNLMQTFALCLLKPNDEVPMNSLSGMLNCDASNVTGIVDRLVMASFITRQESPRDRRIKCIKLTEEGLKVREKLMSGMTTTQNPDLAKLSVDEQAALRGLLQKLLPL